MTEQRAYQDDTVLLTLGGTSVLIATSYSIQQSILKQPAEFSIRLGRGSGTPEPNKGPTVAELIAKYPPNTPFQLRINGHLRMTGKTDGYRASAAGNAATELTIFGRDGLAPLHDAHIDREISFNNATYESLVKAVFKEVGLDASKIVASNEANRKLQAGVNVRQLLPVQNIDRILFGKGDGVTAKAAASVLQTKPGDRWMDYLRKQLDRAGLFLWAAADGTFVLSAPNQNLKPIYRIVRRRGQAHNEVNVIHADYLNDTRPRYTFAVVYGKGGGKAKGRTHSKGDSSDDEMLNTYGFGKAFDGSDINSRSLVVRDAHCHNAAQAAYLAQRKLAEGRRHGFQLVYTMSGLSTPGINGGRAIWTPDTLVEVVDEEFGINSTFWIEAVDFQRSPQSQTTIHLMRTFDIVFGTPDFDASSDATVATGFKGPPAPADPATIDIGPPLAPSDDGDP